ncbi:MAG: isoprenylcysteine carboxylmethyltransferase family protein [Alphaproteobacteria bacterium]|nr:isoprenylcysteine carboxylmethyltransferase family protein [Alphaproteobacteria bacterium]
MEILIGDKWVARFGLVVLVLLVVRTALVFRATGRFPIRFHRTDTAHGFVHLVLAGVLVAFALNLSLLRLPAWLSLQPTDALAGVYAYAGPLQAMQAGEIRLAGFLVAGLGLGLVVVAQHQMGSSWRVGIDWDHATQLVTRGLFQRARHPIYFGFVLLGAGLFLVMPSALSAAAATVLAVVLGIETRLEEEFMLSRHGETYRQYYARTRRWI